MRLGGWLGVTGAAPGALRRPLQVLVAAVSGWACGWVGGLVLLGRRLGLFAVRYRCLLLRSRVGRVVGWVVGCYWGGAWGSSPSVTGACCCGLGLGVWLGGWLGVTGAAPGALRHPLQGACCCSLMLGVWFIGWLGVTEAVPGALRRPLQVLVAAVSGWVCGWVGGWLLLGRHLGLFAIRYRCLLLRSRVGCVVGCYWGGAWGSSPSVTGACCCGLGLGGWLGVTGAAPGALRRPLQALVAAVSGWVGGWVLLGRRLGLFAVRYRRLLLRSRVGRDPVHPEVVRDLLWHFR